MQRSCCSLLLILTNAINKRLVKGSILYFIRFVDVNIVSNGARRKIHLEGEIAREIFTSYCWKLDPFGDLSCNAHEFSIANLA